MFTECVLVVQDVPPMLRQRNTQVLERMQQMADRNMFSDNESSDEDLDMRRNRGRRSEDDAESESLPETSKKGSKDSADVDAKMLTVQAGSGIESSLSSLGASESDQRESQHQSLRSGFICPICRVELMSADGLTRHFEQQHGGGAGGGDGGAQVDGQDDPSTPKVGVQVPTEWGVVKAGSLSKKGRLRTNWTNRFFLLRSKPLPELQYWCSAAEVEAGKPPRGSMRLSLAHCESDGDAEGSVGRNMSDLRPSSLSPTGAAEATLAGGVAVVAESNESHAEAPSEWLFSVSTPPPDSRKLVLAAISSGERDSWMRAVQVCVTSAHERELMRQSGQSNEDYRQRLVSFYTKHNPSKIGTVDKLLRDFKGREDFMFAMLHHKYVVEGFKPDD
jgi:hypothetical protein